MTLSQGRDLIMIPGPSVMPDRVLRAMHRAAPNIYDGELIGITDSILADLCRLAGTKGRAALYICNGHGGWEAVISNLLAPGQRILALTNGRFGEGWADVAENLGRKVDRLAFGLHGVVDPDAVEATLRADKGHRIRLITSVQTDTASSGRNDIAAIRQAMDAAGHPALLAVDAIASFACEPLHMDEWGVDLVLTASQKGLMTPPGIAYVIVNARAEEIAKQAASASPYWDWEKRLDPELYYQRFFGTAPTHLIFAQRAALDMINEEGIENIWNRHEVFARAIWKAAEHWGQDGPLRLNIADAAQRSHAVTTLHAKGQNLNKLRRWCDTQAGLTLGLGLGFDDPEFARGASVMRIGHMGHMNPPMLLGALAVIEAGMQAVGIPHRPGGVERAAGVIASARD